jgi:hypothetical protein
MEDGMQEERNTPQDDDEVEAHTRREDPVEEPGRSALEDDDEVEAHTRREVHIETRREEPSE